MDHANTDTVTRGSRTSLTITAVVERWPRLDRGRGMRCTGIRTGNQINANVEQPTLSLKHVLICMRFVRGASVNGPHQMGFLDSRGTARLAKYRERANFDQKTQSISGESNRLKLEVGRLSSEVRAA
jgi:hypothetical protein